MTKKKVNEKKVSQQTSPEVYAALDKLQDRLMEIIPSDVAFYIVVGAPTGGCVSRTNVKASHMGQIKGIIEKDATDMQRTNLQ